MKQQKKQDISILKYGNILLLEIGYFNSSASTFGMDAPMIAL